MEINKLIELVSDWQLKKENVGFDVRITIDVGDDPSSTFFVFRVTRQVGEVRHWLDGNRAIDIQTLKHAQRADFVVTQVLDMAKALIVRRVQTVMNEGV